MISVIVPVYNAEDYLEEAILSVFSQTYKDWELILVDDGSTDSSPALCDKAVKQSSKVKVTHKPNGGLSSARNAGMEIATGEYFLFLDADDILPANTLQLLKAVAQGYEADIVCGDMMRFCGKTPTTHDIHPSDKNSYYIKTFSPEEAISDILYQKTIENSVSAKLYKRYLWEETRFRENTWYEDLDVFYRVFEKASKIVWIDVPVYFYRQHPGSYLHNFNLRRSDVLKVTERLIIYIGEYHAKLLPAARSRQLSANFNILGLIAANGMTNTSESAPIADECWLKIKELRGESLRNPNVRLKNKIGIIVSYLFGRKGVEVLSKFVYKS